MGVSNIHNCTVRSPNPRGLGLDLVILVGDISKTRYSRAQTECSDNVETFHRLQIDKVDVLQDSHKLLVTPYREFE
jgi:hypothetical protein